MSVQWRENQESSKMKSKGKRMLITSKKWCLFLLPLANKAIIIKRIFFWAEGCYVKKNTNLWKIVQLYNYHLELYLLLLNLSLLSCIMFVTNWMLHILMCLFCRPDFISPLDDLAFDMYQDPEIAGIIRKLEKKKQEAVLRKTIFLHIKIRKQYQCYGNIIPLILILCPINIKCSLF